VTVLLDADTVFLNEPVELLAPYGLVPGQFATVIARPEPENSILEIVKGFSSRKRGMQLAVLGNYDPGNTYHCAVRAAAGPEVRFLGAIYDKAVVRSLRCHSAFYVHGHQVGGTNPSLVEAMGAGNAVIAHDNKFNRWVVGEGARYFQSETDLDAVLTTLLAHPEQLQAMRAKSSGRFKAEFTWDRILDQYEKLLTRQRPSALILTLCATLSSETAG